MSSSVLFTCSAFLSKPNKRAQLRTALRSIFSCHSQSELSLVREIVVINEYSADDHADHGEAVRPIDPRIEFTQKGQDARGHARTLNMILERLRGYEYWLHWEESWVCSRPFLAEALDVMQSTELTQVQLTPDWLDIGAERTMRSATPAGTMYAQILPHAQTAEVLRGASVADYERLAHSHGMGVAWPLFSLRPGINRAAFCREVGPFDEDPRHWPVRFEWEYAVRWFLRGATKAVLIPPASVRQPNHMSTYR